MHDQITLFHTRLGRFAMTRAERYRLALRHGHTREEALTLAYGSPDAEPPPDGHPASPQAFNAAEMAGGYDRDGEPLPDGRGPGILPRCAGAGRAGA